MNQGDIVLISIPFSDLGDKKIRPALIVSNKKVNSNSEDFIVAPISSTKNKIPFSLILDSSNLSKGELKKKSKVKLARLSSLKQNMAIHKIGTLNNLTMKEIKKRISDLF